MSDPFVLLVRCPTCGQLAFNPKTSQCGGRCHTARQPHPAAAVSLGTAVRVRDAGSTPPGRGITGNVTPFRVHDWGKVSEGGGGEPSVRGSAEETFSLPREISPWWLLVVLLGLIVGGWLDGVPL